ncbi:MAG: macro domain-containing protein [Aquisalimonadaceae bacterium]
METLIGTTKVESVVGDITRQNDLDCVVNAANAQLMPGGGVAGAIHRAAGPQLAAACAPLAPIAPGEAVITPGFDLPNAYVIHCLGPVHGLDHPADRLLAACYENALRLAHREGIRSIGFPAISTGAFGYPPEDAAHVARRTVQSVMAELSGPELVRFVFFSESDRRLFDSSDDWT